MQNFEELLRRANQARTRIQEISPAEAESRVAYGAVLIDVREEPEFKARHISGAVLVELESLPSRIGETVSDRTSEVVCYCTVGHRSALAADKLQELGYENVASIQGGLKAYLTALPGRRIA